MSTQAGNKVNLSMSVSADGFVAGPSQDEDNPLGVGGIELHRWHLDEGPESAGHPVEQAGDVGDDGRDGRLHHRAEHVRPHPPRTGALLRTGRAAVGDDRPTSLRRTSSPTTPTIRSRRERSRHDLHFVTEAIESAYEQAKAVAGDQNISIAGGASCACRPSRPAGRRGRPPGVPGDPRCRGAISSTASSRVEPTSSLRRVLEAHRHGPHPLPGRQRRRARPTQDTRPI